MTDKKQTKETEEEEAAAAARASWQEMFLDRLGELLPEYVYNWYLAHLNEKPDCPLSQCMLGADFAVADPYAAAQRIVDAIALLDSRVFGPLMVHAPSPELGRVLRPPDPPFEGGRTNTLLGAGVGAAATAIGYTQIINGLILGGHSFMGLLKLGAERLGPEGLEQLAATAWKNATGVGEGAPQPQYAVAPEPPPPGAGKVLPVAILEMLGRSLQWSVEERPDDDCWTIADIMEMATRQRWIDDFNEIDFRVALDVLQSGGLVELLAGGERWRLTLLGGRSIEKPEA